MLTHRLLPRSESSARAQREDFAAFQVLTDQHGVRLHCVDTRAERAQIVAWLRPLSLDLLACISWRLLITAEELALPRLGGVNLHRGKLPDYAGAHPIEQALRHAETEIVISAHTLTEQIDAGPILGAAHHPIQSVEDESLEQQVARLKREITPRFGPLLLQALEAQVRRRQD